MILDDGSDLVPFGVVPFLSPPFQRDVSPEDYDIVVVGALSRRAVLEDALAPLAVASVVTTVSDAAEWGAIGVAAARGEYIGLFGDPGAPSPNLVSSLLVAVDAYPEPWIVVRTFALSTTDSVRDWLGTSGFSGDGHLFVRKATLSYAGDPPYRFLDPVGKPVNVLASRRVVGALPNIGSPDAHWLVPPADVTRVQIVGDAMVKPCPEGRVESPIELDADPGLHFFGRRDEGVPLPYPSRPRGFRRTERPRLSVILVVHDMEREAPRTLLSLQPSYQRGLAAADYEIHVVDNGSAIPLSEDAVRAVAPEARYHRIPDAPPSPARAINEAVSRSRGDVLAILIDGACLCSPGVLSGGLAAFRCFPKPVVLTRYFFLGPGRQFDTVAEGYDQRVEDQLLGDIRFPTDGYRLFEVASPITYGPPNENWFSPWFESNCLFMPRSVFDDMGGYDERFDLPGGGALNIDVLVRACALPDVQPVQLIGEGVFHQVHGGITTNTTASDHEAKRQRYTDQYVALRGAVPDAFPKTFFFMGLVSVAAARRKMSG